MRETKLLLAFAIFFLTGSCNRGGLDESKSEISLQTGSTAFISSSAATMPDDSTHKFIRTADLKFRVKSVIQSTYDIENTTTTQGGFVIYTNLASNIDDLSTTKISSDSSLETTHYTVSNTITLRVPNTRLDTALKEISKNIDFLDHRIIKADDVALQILSNNLTNKRAEKNQMRLTNAIDKKGKKLNETIKAEELLSGGGEQADVTKAANLSLNDQINFSTINLIIYQRASIKRELISNDKNIEEYQPGLGRKIGEAFRSGWNILENLLVFLVQIWGLLLIALIVFLVYKKYNRKPKK